GLFSSFTRRRDHHTLPLRKSVSLHHEGKFMYCNIGQSWSDLIEALRRRRENLRAGHDLFGVDFAGFDAGVALRRSKYFELGSANFDDNANRKRFFRSTAG